MRKGRYCTVRYGANLGSIHVEVVVLNWYVVRITIYPHELDSSRSCEIDQLIKGWYSCTENNDNVGTEHVLSNGSSTYLRYFRLLDYEFNSVCIIKMRFACFWLFEWVFRSLPFRCSFQHP